MSARYVAWVTSLLPRPTIAPIRWRLTVAYVGVLWLAMTSVGLVLSYLIEKQYLTGYQQVLQSHAVLVKNAIEDEYQHNGFLLQPDETCHDLGNKIHARVEIIDAKNRVIGDSRHSHNPEIVPEDPAEHLKAFGCRVCHPEARSSETISASQPIMLNGSNIGLARISSSSFAIKQASARSRRVVFAALIIAAILAAAISQRLAFSIAKPITEMSSVAKSMAAGDLSQRVTVEGCDEIGQLATSFNVMALQLEKTMGEMAEDRNKMETILTTMADGIIVTDESGRVALFNKASEGIFDLDASEALSKMIDELNLHPNLTDMARETLKSKRMVRRELRLPGPPEISMSAYCYPVADRDSGMKGAVIVLHDLTEIRRHDRVQKEFVANVSHELRTPITAVRVTAEALLTGAKNDPKLLDRFLSTLVKESERLSLLIDDLLEIAKRDSGRREIRRTEMVLMDITERVLGLFKGKAEQHQQEIVQSVPDIVMYADDRQIEQVLANLIDNAIKYTHQGGTITVTAEEDANSVSISVSDTGIGIPPAEVPRIFERFYRVDKARSRQIGGTGLGLSIVKDIVEAHNGTITVQTKPDEGSTFTVTFPKTISVAQDATVVA